MRTRDMKASGIHSSPPQAAAFPFQGPGPDGLLYQGTLHRPAGSGPFPAAIICHPHSDYGGSMEVPLVRQVAATLAERGIVALRFNFRGVGDSQGTCTGGDGEMVDLLGALEAVSCLPEVAANRVGLVGYSFGAWVSMLVAACSELPVGALAAISLPLWLAGPDWQPRITCPKLFIGGDGDWLCPLRDLRAFADTLDPPAELRVVAEADHFFVHREVDVARHVADFLVKHLAGEP